MKFIHVPIKKVHSDAVIPKYETEQAAGFDLHVIEGGIIPPHSTELISTGLAMAIPVGYELQVRPRSGLSLKTMIRIANSPGTIDSDYRGEIKLIVTNIGDEPYEYEIGDRLAQGVLNEIPRATWFITDDLDKTNRGECGFGHTGK